MQHAPGAPAVTLRVQALQRYMAHQGLSLADVARETKVTRQAVSMWLHEHRQPRPRTRPKLLRLLGIGFDDLFKLENGQ